MSSYLDTLIAQFLNPGAPVRPQQSAMMQQANPVDTIMGGLGGVSTPSQVQVLSGGAMPTPGIQGPGGGSYLAAAKAYEETQNQRLPGIAGGIEGLFDLSQAGKRREKMAEEYDKYSSSQQQAKLSQLDQIEQNVFSSVFQMTGDRKEAASYAKLARTNPEAAKSIMTQIAEQRYQQATAASQNAIAMNLKPGTPEFNAYVREATTPKGTQVTVKNEGNIPAGYQVVRDENGQPTRMEPIPGSPADLEQKEGARMAETRGRDEYLKLANAGEVLDEAIEMVGPATSGLIGYGLSKIPGTEAADLEAQVDTLRANSAFKELFDMRQASPTGGALGNVSNREIELLYSAWTNLSNMQSPEQMRSNLMRLKKRYDRVMFLIENKDQIKDLNHNEQRDFADKALGYGKYEKKEEEGKEAKSDAGWDLME